MLGIGAVSLKRPFPHDSPEKTLLSPTLLPTRLGSVSCFEVPTEITAVPLDLGIRTAFLRHWCLTFESEAPFSARFSPFCGSSWDGTRRGVPHSGTSCTHPSLSGPSCPFAASKGKPQIVARFSGNGGYFGYERKSQFIILGSHSSQTFVF